MQKLSYFFLWSMIIVLSLSACGPDPDPDLDFPEENGFYYNDDDTFYPTPQAYFRILSPFRIDFCVASSTLDPNLEGLPTTFDGDGNWITFSAIPSDAEGNLEQGNLANIADFEEVIIDPQGEELDGEHDIQLGIILVRQVLGENTYEIEYQLEGERLNYNTQTNTTDRESFEVKGRFMGTLEELTETGTKLPDNNGFFYNGESSFSATSQGFLVEATVLGDTARTLILGGDQVAISAFAPTFRIEGAPRVNFYSLQVDANGQPFIGRYYPRSFIDNNPGIDHVGTYTFMDVQRLGDIQVSMGDPFLSSNYLDIDFVPSSNTYRITYVIRGELANLNESSNPEPFEVSGRFEEELQELSF